MRLALKLSLPALAVFLLAQLGGCGCGFDCNSDSDNSGPAFLTLGLSDSLPEDLKQVVIEVDSITFRRNGATPIVVDSFTLPGQTVEEPTFHIDLLQYRGVRNLVVINNLELPTGSYSAVEIKVLVGGLDRSFVQLKDNDTLKEITVTNGVLQLPGMQLSSGSQTFVVEFGLAQALQYQATADNYLLANTGIRIADTAIEATLSGQVAAALFNGVTPCSAKPDPQVGNRVYIYQRSSSTTGTLADVFTTASTTTIPANARAPFAVASLLQNGLTGFWEYAFGYLPAGDYTLAFACNTQDDDAVNYNGLTIPLPTEQGYNISLTESQQAVCNLSAEARC